MHKVLIGAFALVLAGCGPIEYLNTVTLQASRAVREAKQAQAERLAPYEYTIAVESLHKARELAGFSRYEQSIAFGKTAVEYGHKAVSVALERARSGRDAHR